MKVVLFCGGKGMRLRDYSESIPKPLAEIGPHPILLHVMKYYAHFGHKEFILCLGHAGHAIKTYFRNFDQYLANDFVLSKGGRELELLRQDMDDWRITFVDTGPNTNIGQRLVRVRKHLEGDTHFLANYSDGLTDLDLNAYIDYAKMRDKTACFITVRPPYSYHLIDADEQHVLRGVQAIAESNLRINGGYFVLKTSIFDHIREGEELVLEPFERLSRQEEVLAYPYEGFWLAMDTFKDKIVFDEMWAQGHAPWRVWDSTPAGVNGHKPTHGAAADVLASAPLPPAR